MKGKDSVSDERFYPRLQRELDLWVEEGIIDREQAGRILSRYGVSEEIVKTRRRYGKLVTIIAILGSITLGVGVILFFASNWQEIPNWVRVLIIFVAILSSYFLGYRFRFEKQNYPKVGSALLLLGAILFGSGIFLIAQIFHINARYPNGVLFWAIGIFPLAYIIGSRPVLTLGLLNMTLWLGMESGPWIRAHDGYIVCVIGLYFIFGCLFYTIGSLHTQFSKTKVYRLPYRIIGLTVVLAASYVLAFGGIWKEASGEILPKLPWSSVALITTFLIALVICIVNLVLKKVESKTNKYEMIGLIALIVFGIILFLPSSPKFAFYAILFNIVLFAEIIGVIFIGYLNNERAFIGIGIAFFAIDLFTRYFDFFWELLPRSVFFIVGGAILIGGGIYIERRGRIIIERLAGRISKP